MSDNLHKKSWQEFKDSGLLWFINNILHLFGWVLCFNIVDDEIKEVYPARTNFRGFSEKSNTEGYRKVTEYLNNNIQELMNDVSEESER